MVRLRLCLLESGVLLDLLLGRRHLWATRLRFKIRIAQEEQQRNKHLNGT
jgi:hypothetical protein